MELGFPKDAFNETFCFEVIIDSHTVKRENTERCHVSFSKFPPAITVTQYYNQNRH